MRIVVVDDNPDIAFLIDALLRRHGYEVFSWSDTEEAMANVGAWSGAALAVVDYALSRDVTGTDLLRWARQEAGFSGRSMVITGSPSFWLDDNDEMLREHVDLVLTKVFDTEEFLDSVKRLVGA